MSAFKPTKRKRVVADAGRTVTAAEAKKLAAILKKAKGRK